MRFEQAFKDARNSGDKTFEFEGKSYSTRMAGEGKSAEKSIPTPPKRDVPREDDPEKTYPAEPVEASPRGYYYNQKLNESADVQSPPTTPKKSRTSMFERMPNPYEKAAKSDAAKPPAPDLVPDIYKGERQVPDQQYRKGGMVKKKSGGTMKKSGGSVRGAGIAQRGQGKMRMC